MDFQPFSVTCVTCSSRLRVSRQELVGSIVACPKCQSMVQLTPPKADPAGPAPIAMGTHLVDSHALTEDSISNAEVPAPDLPDQQPGGGFAEPPPVFTPDPARSAEPLESSKIPDPGDPTPAQTTAPPPNWHSQKNAKSRRIARVVALVLASVVSASILFAVLRRSRSRDPGQQASVDSVPESAVPESAVRDPETVEAEGLANDAEPNTSQPTADVASEPSAGADNAAPDTPRVDPPNDDPPEQTPTAEPSPDSSVPMTSVSRQEGPPPADLLTDSPLLSPSPLDGMAPLTPTPLGNEPDPANDTGTLTELPKELQGLLNGITGIDRPQFSETQPAPQTIDEIQLDRATDVEVDLEVALDQPDPANMRQALGLTIALQTSDPNGYPLNDLMLLLSQFSGVPIEVEWVSFDIVGTPIHSRVKLPNGWPTIEEILTAVCAVSDSTFDINARTITLRPTDQRFNQAVAVSLDLSDLGPESDSAVAVARSLLGQSDGDPSKVSIPTEGGPAQLAVFVCEAIRRARGAEGKLLDASFARWGGAYKDQVTAWPELQGGVSGPMRIQAATLSSLIRQIAKLNGATCYVNWQDGARRDLKPTDKLMPRTGEGVSAAEALKQVLQPENMLVRVVDSQHWWIGSDASLDRFPVVIWFDDAAKGEETKQRVELVLKGAAVSEQVVGAVAVDPNSQKCVAILPRFLLRQLPRMLNETP